MTLALPLSPFYTSLSLHKHAQRRLHDRLNAPLNALEIHPHLHIPPSHRFDPLSSLACIPNMARTTGGKKSTSFHSLYLSLNTAWALAAPS